MLCFFFGGGKWEGVGVEGDGYYFLLFLVRNLEVEMGLGFRLV